MIQFLDNNTANTASLGKLIQAWEEGLTIRSTKYPHGSMSPKLLTSLHMFFWTWRRSAAISLPLFSWGYDWNKGYGGWNYKPSGVITKVQPEMREGIKRGISFLTDDVALLQPIHLLYYVLTILLCTLWTMHLVASDHANSSQWYLLKAFSYFIMHHQATRINTPLTHSRSP